MEANKKRFTLDMDVAMQRRLKVIAAVRGISMRRYCLAAIEQRLAEDDPQNGGRQSFGDEVLDRLAHLQFEVFQGMRVPGDSTDLIREGRDERTATR